MAEFEGELSECLAAFGNMTIEFINIFAEELVVAWEKTAAEIERTAKMNVSVDKSIKGHSHHLQSEIIHRVIRDAQTHNILGQVGVPKESPAGEYAGFLEFGTGKRGAESGVEVPEDYHHPKYDHYNLEWPGMSADPFLYPAIKSNEDFLMKQIIDAYNRAAKRVKDSTNWIGSDLL
jgi:HK97 gp10 family phage protein